MTTHDRRWWWTAALATVLAIWVAGIAHGLAFLDESGHAVFERIAFMHRNGDVAFAQQVGVWSMVVAAVAILTHVVYALALRSERITPLPTAVVVSLAGMVMVPALSAYAFGMSYLPEVHLTRWFWFLVASGGVVAVCGGILWWIAREDQHRVRIERNRRARGSLKDVDPRGGQHDRQGASERSHPE